MKRRGGSTDDDDVGSGNKISHSNNNKKGKMKNPPNNPRRHQMKASATTVIHTNTNRTNLLDLMDPLLQNINSYLPNEDVMKVACVSKRLNTIIPRATTYESRAPGTITTVLHVRPSNHANNSRNEAGRMIGRLDQLVEQFRQLLVRDPNALEGYQHASIEDHHKFQFYPSDGIHYIDSYDKYEELVREIERNGPRIRGITSLDFSLSATSTTSRIANPAVTGSSGLGYFVTTLPCVFPSLRELDLTNTRINGRVVHFFFKQCRFLEKLTFSNKYPLVTPQALLNISGNYFVAANNLKELYMDDCTFLTLPRSTRISIDAMSDLETNNEQVSNTFLFYECSSRVLERVSIRNTKYSVSAEEEQSGGTALPQNALMKYIRHCPPSLRWFRSDLTQDNIAILQRERPDIEFVQ